MNLGDTVINLGGLAKFEPKGVHYRNHGSIQGTATSRRNPKRKSRLPYHARKQLSLVVVTDPNARTCPAALSAHELIMNGRHEQTISYAHGCISKHSSKKVQHRDITGRKW